MKLLLFLLIKIFIFKSQCFNLLTTTARFLTMGQYRLDQEVPHREILNPEYGCI